MKGVLCYQSDRHGHHAARQSSSVEGVRAGSNLKRRYQLSVALVYLLA